MYKEASKENGVPADDLRYYKTNNYGKKCVPVIDAMIREDKKKTRTGAERWSLEY